MKIITEKREKFLLSTLIPLIFRLPELKEIELWRTEFDPIIYILRYDSAEPGFWTRDGGG